METVNYELVKGEIDYDMLLFSQFHNEVICSHHLTPSNNLVLFVVEDHKNDEPDRCYNCHPNHEFEHTLTPHF